MAFTVDYGARAAGSARKDQLKTIQVENEDFTGPSQVPIKPVFKLDSVGGHTTETLGIVSTTDPVAHLVVIPGNPGIVAYYEDFLGLLSEAFGGRVKITSIGHIGHTEKDWEKGRLSSLQDQIEHKVAYMESLREQSIPIILIGHSIGAHIALELLRRFPDVVTKVIGLYPFLSLNLDSSEQKLLGRSARFYPARLAFSTIASTLGFLPTALQNALIRRTIGKEWDDLAIDVTRRYMMNYHCAANYVYMGATEFETFAKSDLPDWSFLESQKNKVALVFGADDHWGPLSLSDMVAERVPSVKIVVEREGLLHAFCCTLQGSSWIATQIPHLCN